MKKGLFAFILLMVVFAGCNMGALTSLPENFDLGTTENNAYTNKYFNMEMKLNEGWVLQSREQLQLLMDIGEASYEGTKLEKAVKSADVRSATLFGMFKYPIDSLVDFNPSLLLIAENVRIAVTVKTGKDYLDQVKSLLKQGDTEYAFSEEYDKKSISGKEFYILTLSSEYPLIGTIKQEYYCTVLNGFALSAIVSYTQQEDKETLNPIVEGIVFKDTEQ